MARDHVLDHLDGVVEQRRRALGLASAGEYVTYLEQQPECEELQEIVNLIAVGKTSFFRNGEAIEGLVTHLMPALDQLLPVGAPVRIWSCACSTGQEAYSLAMALDDAGWTKRRKVQIVGTDINTRSLAMAKAGRYDLRAPADQHPCFRKYASVVDEGGSSYVVDDRLRQLVSFERHNLVDPPYGSLPWHVIVCANVLIYFNSATVSNAIEGLVSALARDGALLLGAGESVLPQPADRGLGIARFGEYYAYVRGRWAGLLDRYLVPTYMAAASEAAASPLAAPVLAATPLSKSSTTATSTARASSSAPTSRTTSTAPLRPSAETPATSPSAVTRVPAAAPAKTRSLVDPAAQRVCVAKLYSDKQLEAALDSLGEAIESDPLSSDLYFVQGCMLRTLGRVDAAIDAFRRALFLAGSFVQARHQYALLLHQSGDFAGAVREYDRVLRDLAEGTATNPLDQSVRLMQEVFRVDDSYILQLCRAQRTMATEAMMPYSSTF